MHKVRGFIAKRGTISLIGSLVSIIVGLLLGLLLLLYFNPTYALGGFVKILTTGFGSPEKFAKVLYQAAPLILTGLSVGLAFKTGLFNIGATGQYTVGAFVALVLGIQFQMPWYIGLIGAAAGGAVWGFFPGICKALFNVNEVITSIMFNWIGLFMTNLCFANMPKMLANYWGATNADRTANLTRANRSAVIPKMGLDGLFNSNYMNISIFIAVLMAVAVYIVMQKTTFGYELKACGYNRDASTYAGINAKKNIVLSMVIAGALAGLAGGIYYLSGTAQYTIVKSLLAMGFNGIPVALLATSNPVGIIFSGMFVSYIQVGGDSLQPEFAKEIIDIIIAAIIYLSAFALLIRGLISKWISKKEREEGEQ
ncbi:ABC transporter permease [Parasporobacterium paucivorans]|uniref:Simple sugar transport system permease protein n=1 Tax=Parasporobacterium paucivorans DSM 15970 TaxID=1122934 RepID=A0A1M6L6W0_9FIRM|nr:ABC transporter permease [Parasporobacterium paucivorans]SHJ66864.1 simple sugar transport system permease protein [Parasporobacterium paucivorans DSM 15970]